MDDGIGSVFFVQLWSEKKQSYEWPALGLSQYNHIITIHRKSQFAVRDELKVQIC